MRRALSLTLIAFCVVAGIAGCKPEPRMTFKRRPKTYSHVVSLSPSTTELIVSTLSVPIVGRTAYDDFPKGSVEKIPIVGSVKPDYEKISALHPDLIVYDASLYNAQDIVKLKSMGADMYSYDPNSLPEFRKEIFEMADLLGGETNASDYDDKILIEENSASAKPPSPTPKVAVMMLSETGNHMIAGTESFLDDIVKRVGGTPVGPSGNRFVVLSPESLVSMNPDIIVAGGTKTDMKGALALLKDPRFQSVNAVKNKHVRLIENDVILRRGARLDSLVRAMYRSISNGFSTS